MGYHDVYFAYSMGVFRGPGTIDNESYGGSMGFTRLNQNRNRHEFVEAQAERIIECTVAPAHGVPYQVPNPSTPTGSTVVSLRNNGNWPVAAYYGAGVDPAKAIPNHPGWQPIYEFPVALDLWGYRNTTAGMRVYSAIHIDLWKGDPPENGGDDSAAPDHGPYVGQYPVLDANGDRIVDGPRSFRVAFERIEGVDGYLLHAYCQIGLNRSGSGSALNWTIDHAFDIPQVETAMVYQDVLGNIGWSGLGTPNATLDDDSSEEALGRGWIGVDYDGYFPHQSHDWGTPDVGMDYARTWGMDEFGHLLPVSGWIERGDDGFIDTNADGAAYVWLYNYDTQMVASANADNAVTVLMGEAHPINPAVTDPEAEGFDDAQGLFTKFNRPTFCIWGFKTVDGARHYSPRPLVVKPYFMPEFWGGSLEYSAYPIELSWQYTGDCEGYMIHGMCDDLNWDYWIEMDGHVSEPSGHPDRYYPAPRNTEKIPSIWCNARFLGKEANYSEPIGVIPEHFTNVWPVPPDVTTHRLADRAPIRVRNWGFPSLEKHRKFWAYFHSQEQAWYVFAVAQAHVDAVNHTPVAIASIDEYYGSEAGNLRALKNECELLAFDNTAVALISGHAPSTGKWVHSGKCFRAYNPFFDSIQYLAEFYENGIGPGSTLRLRWDGFCHGVKDTAYEWYRYEFGNSPLLPGDNSPESQYLYTITRVMPTVQDPR